MDHGFLQMFATFRSTMRTRRSILWSMMCKVLARKWSKWTLTANPRPCHLWFSKSFPRHSARLTALRAGRQPLMAFAQPVHPAPLQQAVVHHADHAIRALSSHLQSRQTARLVQSADFKNHPRRFRVKCVCQGILRAGRQGLCFAVHVILAKRLPTTAPRDVRFVLVGFTANLRDRANVYNALAGRGPPSRV